MYDVVLVSLVRGAGGCQSSPPRTPVLACADALSAAGARVETFVAGSDEEIDARRAL